jgi:hypothetical protein
LLVIFLLLERKYVEKKKLLNNKGFGRFLSTQT